MKDVTVAQYLELKDKVVDGKKLSEKEIADKLGISTATLWNKKTKWRSEKREGNNLQPPAPDAPDNLKQTVEDLRAAKKHLEFNLKDLQSKHEELMTQKVELEKEINRLKLGELDKVELAELKEEMDQLQSEYDLLKSENTQLKAEHKHLREKLDEAVQTREAAADFMIKSNNNIEKRFKDITTELDDALEEREVLLKTVKIIARDSSSVRSGLRC